MQPGDVYEFTSRTGKQCRHLLLPSVTVFFWPATNQERGPYLFRCLGEAERFVRQTFPSAVFSREPLFDFVSWQEVDGERTEAAEFGEITFDFFQDDAHVIHFSMDPMAAMGGTINWLVKVLE